jgi:hypothetical protein
VIDAVARSRGDLGIFRLDQGASAGAWWRALAGPGRPKVIARLPFVERPDHPAGTPVFVVSKPLADAAVRDVILYAAQFERWREAPAEDALGQFGGEVIASAGGATGLSVLLALPGAVAPQDVTAALSRSGAAVGQLVEIGSHAERFRVK